MANGKKKGEGMGDSAKYNLRDIWVGERLGRRNYDNVNKYTKKGTMVESDSLELVSNVLGRPIFKNIESLSNGWIKGTPDVIKPELRDIKSSWDARTFFHIDMEKALSTYYWQLMGYMALTGAKEAHLTYVLVDTPVELAEGDLYRMSFNLQEDEIDKARRNYSFGDIPERSRIKNFIIPRDESAIEQIFLRVMEARIYLKEFDIINGITENL